MYQLKLTGSGMTALINAIFALDTDYRAKIAKGFPDLVEVVNKYHHETGYWEDLVNRWNEESHLKILLYDNNT
jgi:rhamnogalacturonyl hydrolase YesR